MLDFGIQLSDGSGTELTFPPPAGAIDVTNSQIETYAEQFAHGYWACTGTDYTSLLLLGIGTNNSVATDVTRANGGIWAGEVIAVRSYLHSQGWDAQVYAAGANDIEPAWSPVTNATAWVQGYAAATPVSYVDFGSADGCPTDFSTSPNTNFSCANGWSQNDVWFVSWGAAPAQALPEIYLQSQSQSWALVSRYGFAVGNGKIYFEGPLDYNFLNSADYTPA